MPRFYFHVTDGRRLYRDPTGMDLNGLEAARQYALRDARDLLESWMVRSSQPWRIEVADENGMTVLAVPLMEAAVSEAIPLFHEGADIAA
jgi:hypothetical protein